MAREGGAGAATKAPITGVWGLRSEPARRSTAGRAGIGAPNPGSRTPSLPVGRPGADGTSGCSRRRCQSACPGRPHRRTVRTSLSTSWPRSALRPRSRSRVVTPGTTRPEPEPRPRSRRRADAPPADLEPVRGRRSVGSAAATHGEPRRMPPATGYGTQGDRQRRQPPSSEPTSALRRWRAAMCTRLRTVGKRCLAGGAGPRRRLGGIGGVADQRVLGGGVTEAAPRGRCRRGAG